MLNSEEKNALCATKKINILTLVLSKKIKSERLGNNLHQVSLKAKIFESQLI